MGVGDPGVTGTQFATEGVAATPGALAPEFPAFPAFPLPPPPAPPPAHLYCEVGVIFLCIEPPPPPPPPALGAVAASPGRFTGQTKAVEDCLN